MIIKIPKKILFIEDENNGIWFKLRTSRAFYIRCRLHYNKELQDFRILFYLENSNPYSERLHAYNFLWNEKVHLPLFAFLNAFPELKLVSRLAERWTILVMEGWTIYNLRPPPHMGLREESIHSHTSFCFIREQVIKKCMCGNVSKLSLLPIPQEKK